MEEIIEGRQLGQLLQAKQRREEMSISQLSDELKVSQPYLSQLFAGKKRWSSARDELLRSCAAYLDVPTIFVFLLAGRLTASDFFRSSKSELIARLEATMSLIVGSELGMAAGVELQQLLSLPTSVMLLLAAMFEKTEALELLPIRLNSTEVGNFGQIRVPFDVRLVRKK